MSAFLITSLAGLSTLLGTFLIFFKKSSKKILISSLGFAAGVMITISVMDLLPTSYQMLTHIFYFIPALLITFICFCCGMLFSMMIDKYLPSGEIQEGKNHKLYRVGLISCLAIVLHNIPEGIITYITSSQDLKMGISLAIAIALHNIPEGISISVPIYYSTGSRLKAFWYTLISAISEPLGAVLAALILAPFVNDLMMGILYAMIGGIMIHISTHELLPESFSYQKKSWTMGAVFLGIVFMLLNHFLFS